MPIVINSLLPDGRPGLAPMRLSTGGCNADKTAMPNILMQVILSHGATKRCALYSGACGLDYNTKYGFFKVRKGLFHASCWSLRPKLLVFEERL
jgi:hypothetical protein